MKDDDDFPWWILIAILVAVAISCNGCQFILQVNSH